MLAACTAAPHACNGAAGLHVALHFDGSYNLVFKRPLCTRSGFNTCLTRVSDGSAAIVSDMAFRP